jgi:carboxyl-terminal processing protease
LASPPVSYVEEAPAADAGTPSSSANSENPDAELDRALDFERQRNWASALEVYQSAVEKWPGRVEFARRMRLCEIHFKLTRRYQDVSFRNILLRLPEDQALELYREVLDRIISQYVDSVPLEPLTRRGLDNMEVALRDPNFLKQNVGSVDSERINQLRTSLRQRRSSLVIPDREAAIRAVLDASSLAMQTIGINSTPVILEFTCGACDALDDFTSYLTPSKLDDLYAMIDGNFVGLGVELKNDAEGLRIVGVIRNGPAWEAGLKAGDEITAIGGRAIKGLGLDEAANRLQGAEGTTVDLGVLHKDGSSRSYRLVRRHVDVDSVTKAEFVDRAGRIGYIQLTGFQKTSPDEIDAAVAELNRQGMRALVLDLRGNPGGLLNVAVEIADRFVSQGVIVSTRGRAAGQNQVFRATGQGRWNFPLLILIDHDSASASEILAGALQDHRRAIVVGERSYGKGSVQSIFSLHSAPAGLKLTTAKFYSPKNRPYSEQGVSPDIPIKTRVTAKPTPGSSVAPTEDVQRGDPSADMVLAAAIRAAKDQLNPSR